MAILTAGTVLKYIVEATADTMPASGFTTISGIKSIPELNPEPSSHETTDLSATTYKTYMPGLKDPGGSLAFKANHTQTFQTAWEALMTAYSSLTAGKGMWFEIVIPGLTKSFQFRGTPSAMGLSAIEVDGVLECDVHITPNKITGWGTKST